MRIYKFMLRIPFKSVQKLESAFSFKLKYAIQDLYTDDLNPYVNVLYAWTDNKSIRNMFREYRHKKFIFEPMEIDDRYMKEFKYEFKMQELVKVNIYDLQENKDGRKYLQVLTKDEKEVLENYFIEVATQILESETEYPYTILKDEFALALDVLGYTIVHGLFYPTTQQEEDLTGYQLSYQQSPYGRSIYDIFSCIDPVLLFNYLFNNEEMIK